MSPIVIFKQNLSKLFEIMMASQMLHHSISPAVFVATVAVSKVPHVLRDTNKEGSKVSH